jgi:DNA-directed RNA polymerase subunit RPC12/RpoP
MAAAQESKVIPSDEANEPAGKGGICRICQVGLPSGSMLCDTLGGRYCRGCFLQVRQNSPGSADVLFRCSICGDSRPAIESFEQDGGIACVHCSSASTPTASTVEARAPAAQPQSQHIDKLLDAPLPPNVLAKITCPHCWHQFAPDETLWVSQHAELLGDPVLGPEANCRFRPSRFNVRGEAIDARDMPCQLLACPRCHLIVPRPLIGTEPLFFSIIGSPASGKSHFLASMTWQLRRILPSKFFVSFGDADTVSNRLLNEYEEVLFLQDNENRLVSIGKTELQGELYDQIRLGQQVISLPHPFMFTLRPRRPSADAETAPADGPAPAEDTDHSGVRVLCLYDNAGEHFQPGMDSVSSPGTQHLSRSRALMFVYDPAQHPRFRELCRKVSRDPQLHGASRTLRQETLLTEASLRVRRYLGLPAQKKHSRPLVVIVSKADIWAPVVRANFEREPFVSLPGENGLSALNLDRVEKMSGQLRSMLVKITPEFVAAAEDFCEQVVYIPVSALGRSPEVQKGSGLLGIRPRDIRPQWVTVPFLYVASKWSKGLIAGIHGRG